MTPYNYQFLDPATPFRENCGLPALKGGKTMSIKRFAVGMLAAGALLAAPAYGQLKDSGFYIGGGLGWSDASIDSAGINAAATAVGFASAATTADDNDTGFKLFAGYQLNRNFAVEVGYANLGKFSTITTTTGPAATISGEVKVENNWFADLVGIVPFGNNFSFFGRIGLLYSETKVSAFGAGPGGTVAVNSKEDDISWKAGLGIGYDFTNQFGIRGEWERYRVSEGSGGGKADVDLWSVSLRFRF
jgi:OmpA-OmpF porin, OOP family